MEEIYQEDKIAKYLPTIFFLSAIIICITGFVLKGIVIILSGVVLFIVSVWCMNATDKAEKSRKKILAMIREEDKDIKKQNS